MPETSSTWNGNVEDGKRQQRGERHLSLVLCAHTEKCCHLMMMCHDNVACCFSYVWKMTFFYILCVRCWVSVHRIFFLSPPPPANGSMKRYESGGLDINFSGVSGFIVNAPSDMSEKLKRRQSVVVTVWDIRWMLWVQWCSQANFIVHLFAQ